MLTPCSWKWKMEKKSFVKHFTIWINYHKERVGQGDLGSETAKKIIWNEIYA